MLILCPECELQVSDKAVSCPHCGYPIKTVVEETVKSSKKECEKEASTKRIRKNNGNKESQFKKTISSNDYSW